MKRMVKNTIPLIGASIEIIEIRKRYNLAFIVLSVKKFGRKLVVVPCKN